MVEFSKVMENLLIFFRVFLVPINSNSILLLFSLRKFVVNQDLISESQLIREESGSEEFGLLER